jgi:hypothetical protein
MTKRTEAWWTCNKCNLHLIRPGKKKIKEKMLEHRKTCDKIAGFYLVQVSQ